MNPPLYQTVTAMIAPALFLTATSSLIISTANRMGRIIDRIRKIIEQANQIALNPAAWDYPDARIEQLHVQLEGLRNRNRRTLVAVTELYLGFGSFVGSSLAIAVDYFTGHHLSWLPMVFATGGVVLLCLASINLVREARMALRTNHLEVDFYYELVALRKHQQPGAAKEKAVAEAKKLDG